MSDFLRPLQLDDADDDDELPPPIPVQSQQQHAQPSAPEPVLQDSASTTPPRRFRQRATSWSASSAPPPPLPPAPPAELALASTPASALLQKSLQALSGGRRVGPAPSDADDAFNQLVAAAAEAKLGVGLRIIGAQPATCAGTIEGQSASRHPLAAQFAGSKIATIDGVEVASKSNDAVCDMLLGAFGSVCSVQFEDGQGDKFTASLLRASAEFFTSYEEQVKRLGSMLSPTLSAAMQAQNTALQEKVNQLRAQLREADDKVEHAMRALENAQMNVKMQEDSSALSKILEEEETLTEISRLEACVKQLTREVALKDSVIQRHDLSVLTRQEAASGNDAALRAELAKLASKCAALEKQNADAAAAFSALKEESAAKQRAAPSSAVISEILKSLAVFEEQVPKLTANVARLEAELQCEKRLGTSRQAELNDALARESSWCDRVQQLEEQLQHAASRCVRSVSAPPRDPVFDCFVGSGNDAWDAAVQRHAVSVVVGSVVERTVARAGARLLLQRQPTADSPSPSTAAVITHDMACQSGCSVDDVGILTATLTHDLSKCLDHIGKAAGLPVPLDLCANAVDALLRALLTGDCSASALPEVEAWCARAADRTRSFELRAIAIEGERDGLLRFREQLEQENARLVMLYQKQQQRQKEVESAMLASVSDVQQLAQQMGSLLTIIKEKSAENSDLLRQTTRMKQLLTIQNDLRQQIEGQKQQLVQYHVLERESLQLKMSRDDAVQRLEQLEHELLSSQDAQRHMENDLFKAREMLMDAELRLFSMEEGKARLQSERDSAEATLLAFDFLRSGGIVTAKRMPLSPSNRQTAPLHASMELLAVDIKDSSAAALQQAQELFDSLASVAACSQLFSSALDLCERCMMNASEQGLRMSNELHALTEQSNGLSAEPAEVFVSQLEANSDRAVQIGARMSELMVAMKAQYKDLASRYSTLGNQHTVFEHAAAEADKGSKHLQWLVKRRLALHKEGQQPPLIDDYE